MSIPAQPVDVPERVRALARGAALEPVWQNELGGLTFRTDDERYIKFGPRNAESSMRGRGASGSSGPGDTSASRTCSSWARTTTHEWMVTRALPGESAVAPRWLAEPATAVRAVGEGLRALHDALPVGGVPVRVERAVAHRERGASRGIRLPDALREPPPDRPARRLPRRTPAARTR